MLQDGETALHWAAEEGEVEVVEILMKYGAAVDVRNRVNTGWPYYCRVNDMALLYNTH